MTREPIHPSLLSHRRRAAALLLALAALVVISASSLALVHAATSTARNRSLDAETLAADDLLHAAESAIESWLETRSLSLVLPADVETPETLILHDAWQSGGIVHELRITAWDQCGMVPAADAARASPLRSTLPGDIARLAESSAVTTIPTGLDTFRASAPADTLIFPVPAPHSTQRLDGASEDAGAAGKVPLVLGALVATHNPPAAESDHRPRRGALINVNTAPLALIDAALRSAGRGGVDQIAAARAAGRAAPTPGATAGNLAPITFIPASICWSIRTDIRAGPVRRSWWSIYARTAKGWELRQRLAIPE